MSLQKYKSKRILDKTPEPKSGVAKLTDEYPLFVIQKHAARHLHYDLRLECKGVLLSWAIPKGPSQDPSEKRLAIHVEDHPYDYKDFEGVIPKGHYGAGKVVIWDSGLYTTKEGLTTKKAIEAKVKAGLKKGELELVFIGKKIKGGFVLVQTHFSESSDTWLMIKKNDEYAK